MKSLLDMRASPARIVLVAALVGAVGIASAAPVDAADWPHWRGPTRDGHTDESSGWNGKAWVANRPAWSAELGIGSGSVLVVDGRLYGMGWKEGRDWVHALDATSGAPMWAQSYEAPRHARFSEGDKGLYAGPTSTPEFDPATGLLYTLGADGRLSCWDTTDDGRPVWDLNLYDKFDVTQRPKVRGSSLRDYGYTSSPLVLGRWLIVEVGARQGSLAAFDKATGRLNWRSRDADPAGHTGGPVPIEVEGVQGVAVLTLRNLLVVGVDKKQRGKTIASYPWVTSFANNIATPAVHGNSVLITSAYNHDSIARIDITLEGAQPIWERPYPSKVCSPVIHEGHVYFAWQKARCLDFESGAQRWEGGSFGDAGSVIVTADDKLIVWGGAGRLALVETATKSPTAYEELHRKSGLFVTDVWPHVVLADGRLYLKDRDGNLQCLPLLTQSAPPVRNDAASSTAGE